MEISAKQATKCKNSHAQWYLSEKNVKSHARRPKEGDKSFRPEEEADEDDQDDEDVEADTHPTEEEAAKPQCIAHPIKALLASEADDAMAALWDKKELTDAEQAVKDRIDELLPYLGKNERRVLALKVYYMVREHGAGIGSSLQFASSLIERNTNVVFETSVESSSISSAEPTATTTTPPRAAERRFHTRKLHHIVRSTFLAIYNHPTMT